MVADRRPPRPGAGAGEGAPPPPSAPPPPPPGGPLCPSPERRLTGRPEVAFLLPRASTSTLPRCASILVAVHRSSATQTAWKETARDPLAPASTLNAASARLTRRRGWVHVRSRWPPSEMRVSAP